MIVIAPMTTTTVCATGAASKIGADRAIRYTPAVTIVAAWMSAETGVGPSMASGSQACNGNWPDLPDAPSSRSSPIAVTVPPASSPTEPSTPA